MNLSQIEIRNYRSIDRAVIEIDFNGNGARTIGLLGLNEAGKSSLLKAIALKDGTIKIEPKDFRDKQAPVEIVFTYCSPGMEANWDDLLLVESVAADVDEFDSSKMAYVVSFAPQTLSKSLHIEVAKLNGKIIRLAVPEGKTTSLHRTIFWTAEDKYLISRPIELSSFAVQPDAVSIPLRNCFLLADIRDISARIKAITGDSTEVEHLQDQLGTAVTQHIKNVWPNHPIRVTFLISDGNINFHVRDEGAGGKAKTADQRSDGFKQFVSFLLTVSAENKNQELKSCILLLDEPETHLHPLAQEYLLGELIKITQNDRFNVCLFATHSVFMIDKVSLTRNVRVSKPQETTVLQPFAHGMATYASVTYDVFDIPTTDYFVELYSSLHLAFQEADDKDPSRGNIKNFDQKYFHEEKSRPLEKPWKGIPNSSTIHTFIRNCIHHPDNGESYTQVQLRSSIAELRSFVT